VNAAVSVGRGERPVGLVEAGGYRFPEWIWNYREILAILKLKDVRVRLIRSAGDDDQRSSIVTPRKLSKHRHRAGIFRQVERLMVSVIVSNPLPELRICIFVVRREE
jgi:hypothetical protein